MNCNTMQSMKPNIPPSYDSDTNPDPITGEPGAHPVGTAVGGTGGALTGAAIGSVAGPIGTVVGGAIGAVVGGLAGKGVAEAIDPTEEDAYWRENHDQQTYADNTMTYDDDYAPAYRHGYVNVAKDHTSWNEAEKDLAVGWEKAKGQSRLSWEKAKSATRAGWERVKDSVDGD